LAEVVVGLRAERPYVLALPRGGVPVGAAVAASLHAPLEVVVSRKLGAPGFPEYALGAVAEGGVRVLNRHVETGATLEPEQLDALTERERAAVNRAVDRYRAGAPLPTLAGRTAIVVDDGLATGLTAEAALLAVSRLAPERLVLAVPVCAADTGDRLAPAVDDLVCVERPVDLRAVGLWYRDFAQTTDDEVLALLGR
jgi:putative phosphoribosyl transferase